jgi:hypothetical protein
MLEPACLFLAQLSTRCYHPGMSSLKSENQAQQVTVTTDSSVALKPLLESAVRTELRMLEIGLERTAQRLRDFEERFGLGSEEFERRFDSGQIDESLDFIEWVGEIKTYRLLQAQRQELQGVRLH